jgi:hypothetical protein
MPKPGKKSAPAALMPPLPREEWDFRQVPDDELEPCLWWEYARESARVRAYYQPADSDFFPCPGMHPEVRGRDGRIIQPARRRMIDPERMHFTMAMLDWAFPVGQTMQRTHEAGIEATAALDLPWVRLPETVRRTVVEDLAPYRAKKPAMTYLPFNRCSDLRDLGIADKDYRCAQFDAMHGIERLRVQIDWGQFTDSQIIAAFRCWVDENRPLGVGVKNERGRRKGKGLAAYLKALGIMRLMNATTLHRIEREHPEIWKAYGSMDWPRARKDAGDTFRTYFHFLPEADRPLHWRTAGGRSQ